MSPLAHSLLALAAAALLQGACADPIHLKDNCARFLVGRTSDTPHEGGAVHMPVHVTQRHGWVPIPPYGLVGVHVVGQLVNLCNLANRIAPHVTPKGKVNSPDLKMYVHLSDGEHGPANMEMYVTYYLEPIWHD